MVLQRLSTYIKTQQRVEESALLKAFHLKANGLAPMIEILIRNGHVQKTINNRGDKLPVQVFYTWQERKVIPMTTML